MNNKIKFLLAGTLLLGCELSYSNDSVFYSEGGTLMPLLETTISLKKEILNLTRYQGNMMKVEVYFEFHNPAGIKEEIVGFVAPPPFYGDSETKEREYLEKAEQHPEITDFNVTVNGESLSYQVQRSLGKTDFKMIDRKFPLNEFVYYFKVKFEKGINIITHSYSYRGGIENATDQVYRYTLTSGKRWANSEISRFEMNINIGEKVYFFVPHSFWKNNQPITWEVIGSGIVEARPYLADEYYVNVEGAFRMVTINKGILRFQTERFKPDYDLAFGFLYFPPSYKHGTPDKWCDKCEEYEEFMDFRLCENGCDLTGLSNRQLWLYRNYLFALHGYLFKNPELRAIFTKFYWYQADKSVKNDVGILTEAEIKTLNAIIKEEMKRKKR
jgi:hypothetical protein